MGSSPVSVEILQHLLSVPQVNVSHVWTHPPRPSGRGQKLHRNPVATFVHSLTEKEVKDVQLREPQRIDIDEIKYLQSLNLDTIIVAAYGQILPSTWLDTPRLGCFNIHFSLLPRYRGASPIQAAILNGDEETGITIQKMAEKLDSGDIVLSRSFRLTGLNAPQAFAASLDAFRLVLPEFIRQLISGNLKLSSQGDEVGEYCRKIKKSDGWIRSPMNIDTIYRKFLAYQPWPGIYFKVDSHGGEMTLFIQGLEQIKVDKPPPNRDLLENIRSQYDHKILDLLLESHPQPLYLIKLTHPPRLLLAARKSESPTPNHYSEIQFLNLTTIQKSGKKTLPVQDFLNGIKWTFPLPL